MGVKGLWGILQSVARPTAIESLVGKILTIDVSLWLHQALHASADPSKKTYLATLFTRLTKLLFYQIRPIVVFDGPNVPIFKKQVLASRKLRKSVASHQASQSRRRLVIQGIRKRLLQRLKSSTNVAQSASTAASSSSNDFSGKNIAKSMPTADDDLFALRPIPADSDILPFLDESSSDDSDSSSSPHSSMVQSPLEVSLPVMLEGTYDIDWNILTSLPLEMQKDVLSNLRTGLQKSPLKFGDHLCAENVSQQQMKYLSTHQKVERHYKEVQQQLECMKAREALRQLSQETFRPETMFVLNTVADNDAEYVLLRRGTVFQQQRSAELQSVTNEGPSELELSASSSQTTHSDHETVLTDSTVDTLNCLDIKPTDSLYETDTEVISINESDATGEAANKIPSTKVLSASTSASSSGSDYAIIDQQETSNTALHSVPLSPQSPITSAALITSMTISESIAPTSKAKAMREKSLEIIATPLTDVHVRPTTSAPSDVNVYSDGSSDDDEFVTVLDSPLEAARSTAKADVTRSESQRRSMQQLKDTMQQVIDDEVATDSEQLQRDLARQTLSSQTLPQGAYQECIELLALLGIPYVQSPGEAEAQCAWLELQGLSHGTITDDSDVWLFGARRVYRHFFHRTKQVELFRMEDIEKVLGLSCHTLRQAAMLSGCDYTSGIAGIGAVTALEILSEFRPKGGVNDPLHSLKSFRAWNEQKGSSGDLVSPVKERLRRMHLEFPENFPNEHVFHAFDKAEVDRSTESFTWGRPDLHGLRIFAEEKLKWPQSRTDDFLLPVLRRWNQQDKTQTKIQSFCVTVNPREQTLSKRVQSAAKGLKGQSASDANRANEIKSNRFNEAGSSAKQTMTKRVTRGVAGKKGPNTPVDKALKSRKRGQRLPSRTAKRKVAAHAASADVNISESDSDV